MNRERRTHRLLLAAAVVALGCPAIGGARAAAPDDASSSDAGGAVRVDDFGGRVPRDLPGVTTTPLEDDFFDLLWRCDAPDSAVRDSAAKELTRRFGEFELVWMNRAFLTDGEISETAAAQFLSAEAAAYERDAEESRRAARVEWNVGAPEIADDGVETRHAVLRFSWNRQTRFVWAAPDLRNCRWREPGTGRLWRPRARFSQPELIPGFDDDFLDVEIVLEPDPEFDADGFSASDDSGGEAAGAVAAFDALAGIGTRVIRIPVGWEDAGEREYRIGGLTLRGAPARYDSRSGEWTIALRLQYAEPFDAFDSHRAWYDANDFKLTIPSAEKTLSPVKFRAAERDAYGERIELTFRAPEIDDAAKNGEAWIQCRLPRYFVRERRIF